MQPDWEGVYPAVLTPFRPDGQVDESMFMHALDSLLGAGIRGVVLGGSLGEASVLRVSELEQMTRLAVSSVNGRVPVIVNVAESSLDEAISRARAARGWGAGGLMVLPPLRYRPDEREILEWFRRIARASDLPMMIYNNPVDYGTEITPSMFEQLAGEPLVQAVKESTRDVSNVTRMRMRFGDRFRILCGVDTLAMEELCMGADGWVAGLVCAFPAETVRLYNLVRHGELEKARALYRWFLPLLELDIHPKLVQYIKLAAAQTGLCSETVRAPRLVLEGEERKKILKIIEQAMQRNPVDQINA